MSNESNRKRRRTPDQVRELLSRYQQSELTRSAFVKVEGICLATLAKYLKGEAAFHRRGSGGFVEVEHAGAIVDIGRRSLYRICLRQGVDLEIPPGFSVSEVARLLELISAPGAR